MEDTMWGVRKRCIERRIPDFNQKLKRNNTDNITPFSSQEQTRGSDKKIKTGKASQAFTSLQALKIMFSQIPNIMLHILNDNLALETRK